MTALRGFLTTAEAAERLGISANYVRSLIQEGRLKAERVGQRVLLVDAESVRKFRRRPRGRPRKKKSPKAK